VLPRIFEPYISTKAPFSILNQTGNSGLGLSTARDIVVNQGGFIAVETELDVGTTFHVYLPEATRRTSSTQMLAFKHVARKPRQRSSPARGRRRYRPAHPDPSAVLLQI
jgi:hypothetical protein